jgi:hypothetical protein
VYTGRNNFDVLSVPKQTAKKPFRNRAAADITCADKEDAFHNSESASERNSQPRVEPVQVNFAKECAQGASAGCAQGTELSAGQLQPELVPNVQNENRSNDGYN